MYPEPKLSWRSWPFTERPLSSSLLLVFLLFLTAFLYRLAVLDWQMPLFYVLGLALVYGNLLPYFIITEYYLYDDKIMVRYLFFKVERPWTDFGCFYQDKRGIMLSTFKMPRRLDPFRGQSLRFSKTQTEVNALLEFLKDKIGRQY
jgi:hypothetical protein